MKKFFKFFGLGLLALIVILVIVANMTEEVVPINKKEFKEIKTGMTYDEVKDIIGGKAKEVTEFDDTDIVDYEFDGENGVEEDATVTLVMEDGKVRDKIEYGLLESSSNESTEEDVADNTSEGDVTASTDTEEDTTAKDEKSGSEVVTALESNNFVSFVNSYKELGSDKTTVWDNDLYGKTVTWTGTVVDVGGTQLFVYGSNDYNGEDWQQLSDNKKLFYAFTAKYANPAQFQNVKPGDKVTVQGSLESRGDYDLGFNWKLYNVVLK